MLTCKPGLLPLPSLAHSLFEFGRNSFDIACLAERHGAGEDIVWRAGVGAARGTSKNDRHGHASQAFDATLRLIIRCLRCEGC